MIKTISGKTSAVSPIRFLVVTLATASCGTKVEVGDNEEHGDPRSLDSSAVQATSSEDTTIVIQPDSTSSSAPETADADTPTTSSTTTPKKSGGSYTLTCFGPAPELSADFQSFCNDSDPEMLEVFATHYDLICNEKRMLNLFFDQCSWDGQGSPEKKLRILERTDIAASELDDFYFLGGYSFTADSPLDDYIRIVELEILDPTFPNNFIIIENSKIENPEILGDGHYHYDVTLANAVATVSFRARYKVERFGENLAVIYDHAISDKVIIKDHKLLSFIIQLADGRTRIMAVDEKLVFTKGNHAVAQQNLIKILKERMVKGYENSRRD